MLASEEGEKLLDLKNLCKIYSSIWFSLYPEKLNVSLDIYIKIERLKYGLLIICVIILFHVKDCDYGDGLCKR